MKKETIKTLTQVTGILSIIGAALVVLTFIISATTIAGSNDILSSAESANAATFVWKIVIGLIGLATFVTGIILIVNLKKFEKTVTSGVLVVIAGVFAWIITPVSLVLWIIAAIFLFRMKFTAPEENL